MQDIKCGMFVGIGWVAIKKSILVSSIKYLEHLITSRDSLAHDILMETYKYNPSVVKIKSWLQMLGFPFLNQRIHVHSVRPFLPQICQRATDIYLQEQYSKVMESSKLEFYLNHLEHLMLTSLHVKWIEGH